MSEPFRMEDILFPYQSRNHMKLRAFSFRNDDDDEEDDEDEDEVE